LRLDVEDDAELLERDIQGAILVLDRNGNFAADEEIGLATADASERRFREQPRMAAVHE
jgi:hypothetical protein